MVVDDLDISDATRLAPFETYAPLVVDPDAVLAGSVASQLFEVVAGCLRKNSQANGLVQDEQLAQRRSLDVDRQFARAHLIEYPFAFFAFEGFDHAYIIDDQRRDVKCL
jgi:hypothetical protein